MLESATDYHMGKQGQSHDAYGTKHGDLDCANEIQHHMQCAAVRSTMTAIRWSFAYLSLFGGLAFQVLLSNFVRRTRTLKWTHGTSHTWSGLLGFLTLLGLVGF